jgi:ABC-2 type transport system permease protein
MHKVFVIALREYRAAVRSKAFIITLVMVPVLISISILAQVIVKKFDDTKPKTYGIIDRTAGSALFGFLEKAVEHHNAVEVFDKDDKEKRVKPSFDLVRIEASAPDADAIAAQRLELSERCLKGELDGFLDIGPGVLDYGEKRDADKSWIRYQSNKITNLEFQRWVEPVVNAGIRQHRFADAGVDLVKIQVMQTPTQLKAVGVSRRDPATGKIVDSREELQVASFIVPFALVGLMYLMILLGSTPAMQGVVEEKMQKIVEVLLGSVSPFQLMFGKLLGIVAVSLTIMVVYMSGIYFVASRYEVTEYLSVNLLIWFAVFLILAVLMFGSLFLAVGAAATDTKETQSLMMPLMCVIMLPWLMIGAIMQDTNSAFATALSLFPPSTPMLMTARLAVPPGIPWWQPLVGVIGVLATTFVCVYIAGRIFRVGILMQGKGAKYSDLVKWAING